MDKEEWGELVYTLKVYAIFMVTFVFPMLGLYVLASWLVGVVK